MKTKIEKMYKGFTLIELLVVVLIIGILSAIALPQYQRAVVRTRYATLKNMVHSIANAQELYYMSNNDYSTKFENLDIDPGGTSGSPADKQRNFTWGNCQIVKSDDSIWYVECYNSQIAMTYRIYLQHSSASAGKRDCVYFGTDTSSAQYAVCKSETRGNLWCGESACERYYPD